jgi:hypothetical protein
MDMKIKLFTNSGIFDRSVVLEGFTMVGYLTLARLPMTANEAATKNYVDNFPYNLSVENITGGVVPIDKIADGIDGDVCLYNKTQVVLRPVGASGSYSRVTVNAKGQIIAGLPISQDNALPSLSFSEIKNRPTGVDGYTTNTTPYIRNTVGFQNTALSDNLTLSRAPTTEVEATTFGYLTSFASRTFGSQNVGDLAIKPNTVAHDKYLRTNGAWVERAVYPDLFALIGLTYSTSGGSGGEAGYAGQPWAQQGAFNDTDNSTSLGMGTAGSFPITIAHATPFVTKNRVYVVGGYQGPDTSSNTATINKVYTTTINSNGTLGSWAAASAFPISVASASVVVTKGYVYIFGGQSTMTFLPDSGGETVLNSVYMAKINEDGTIGAWSKTTNLPFANSCQFMVVVKNYVYMIGGYNGSAYRSSIYRAPINSDGTIGSWVSAGSVPVAVSTVLSIISVTKTYVHIVLGNVRYSAAINADGTLGGWSTYNPGFSVTGLSGYQSAGIVSTQKRAYAIGGTGFQSTWIGAGNGGSVSYASGTQKVHSATINADGTMGSWTSAQSLPVRVGAQVVFVTSSRVYCIGGLVGYGDVNNPIKYFSITSTIYYSGFGGGTNDYIALIVESGIDPTLFKLPDWTAKNDGIYEYYIKALP